MKRRKKLLALVEEYVGWMAVVNFSAGRVKSRRRYLQDLLDWCGGSGIWTPDLLTPGRVMDYCAWLMLGARNTGLRAGGQPLTVHGRRHRIVALRAFSSWLAKHGHILYDVAADVAIVPPRPDTVPRHVFTAAELERLFAQPLLGTPEGLRDRAMMETLYSTGLRARELVRLDRYDLDMAGGTVMVREGKGGKDRVVPIGERAIHWIARYLLDARPLLEVDADDPTLFLLREPGARCEPQKQLGNLVARYMRQAGIHKPGCCHLFRHTMATQMLENGADTRYIQEILGHVQLTTTQIYTRVAIPKLKAVHTSRHPAREVRPTSARVRAWSKHVLSPEEVELVFSQPDVATTRGLRDRAILEVLHATGMLARELLGLTRGDVDHAAGTVRIRGRERERVVPLGSALTWVERYEHEARPAAAGDDEIELLFLLDGPRTSKHVAGIVMPYVAQAGVAKRDGCDLLRRTAWAHLRAKGVDVASVRTMLGMRQVHPEERRTA